MYRKPIDRAHPAVSIVLPCYNGERFLKQSLDSILSQNKHDWELIIVDDCSTDNSGRIADDYAACDSRISVIHNKQNKKLPASLNIGFAHARGKYFTWTSDDNIAKPDWLSVLSDYLDANPSTDMVSACTDYMDDNGHVYASMNPRRDIRQLAHICNIGAAFMYRKTTADKIGKYDEDMFCAEDYDYWTRIALNGQIDYINNNIYQYRSNPQSLTATQQPRIQAKTSAIHNKYKNNWIQKLNLGWWGKQKLSYLMRDNSLLNPAKIWYGTAIQFLNILLFWNPTLRRTLKQRIKSL